MRRAALLFPRGPAQRTSGATSTGAHGETIAMKAPRGPRSRTAGELPDLALERTHQALSPAGRRRSQAAFFLHFHPATAPGRNRKYWAPYPFALPGVRRKTRIALQEAKGAARSRFA